MKKEPEVTIYIHRAFRTVLPPLVIGLVLAWLIQYLPSKPLGVHLSLNEIDGDSMFFPLSMLIIVLAVVRSISVWFDSSYCISPHHIYETTGRCSLKRQHVELAFEDVRGVRSEQSLLQRLLGVGAVVVWTASANAPAVIMRGIYQPDRIVSLIQARLDRRHMNEKAKKRA